jgi:hypothetical protein
MAADDGVPHDAGVAEARERVALRNQGEADDRIDSKLASQALLTEVGLADFTGGQRVLQKYVRELPADERAKIAADPNFFHDPEKIKALANKAIGDVPTRPEEIDAELEASRKRMRDDPRGWYADDRAQIRYRRLLRAKGTQ